MCVLRCCMQDTPNVRIVLPHERLEANRSVAAVAHEAHQSSQRFAPVACQTLGPQQQGRALHGAWLCSRLACLRSREGVQQHMYQCTRAIVFGSAVGTNSACWPGLSRHYFASLTLICIRQSESGLWALGPQLYLQASAVFEGLSCICRPQQLRPGFSPP